MTTRIGLLALVAATLATGAGCAARPDWIEQTLVTADVSGTWRTMEGSALRLVLEQQGTKVTGKFFLQPSSSSGDRRSRARWPATCSDSSS